MKRSLRISIDEILAFVYGLSFLNIIPLIGSQKFSYAFLLAYIVLTLRRVRKIKISDRNIRLFIGLLVFLTISVFSNIVNQGDTSWTEINVKSICGVLLALNCYVRSNTRAIYYLVIGCNLWNAISFLDVYYQVVFTNYDSYSNMLLLCGYDNGLGAFLLPLICLNFYFYHAGKNRFMTIGSIALSAMQILLVWSATALVGVVLLLLFVLVESNFRICRKFKLWMMMTIDGAVFLFVVILRVYDNPFTRWLIVDVLHKTMDFTSRTYVWDRAIMYASLSPWIGHGRQAEYQKTILYGVTSAHNCFLDILNQTGLIGMTIFALCLLAFSLRKYPNASRSGELTAYLYLILVLVMQFESYCAYTGYPLFFVLFAAGIVFMNIRVKDRRVKTIKLRTVRQR